MNLPTRHPPSPGAVLFVFEEHDLDQLKSQSNDPHNRALVEDDNSTAPTPHPPITPQSHPNASPTPAPNSWESHTH
ncbi:MAG: hypothetical protein JKY43_09450, partial [Phycisphaerales bacterium]|nr:hypothetical protein [Phycisphaerales bacterium]